jgi:hypothetical protein
MPRQLSSQTAFLLRVVPLLGVMFALWWFALLPPLLGWERMTTDLLLAAFPKAPVQTGASVLPDGSWVLEAPARVAGVTRNIRVALPPRLPIQLTVGFPLFWAILLAAPRAPRVWRAALLGTAALLALPPIGLLAYAAHVVQIYVFPGAPAFLAHGIAAIDYVASTVAPFVCPVMLAVALHPELAGSVLGERPGHTVSHGKSFPLKTKDN